MIKLIQRWTWLGRALDAYERFTERYVFPVLRELRPFRWLPAAVIYGVVALLVGHIAGELAGGVAVAIVVLLTVAMALDDLWQAGSLIRSTLMVWLLASVSVVALETPEAAQQMLTDSRVVVILGAMLGGAIIVVLLNAFMIFAAEGYDDWIAYSRRERIAKATGMTGPDVDRVLAALDNEMVDDMWMDGYWEYMSTADGYSLHRELLKSREWSRRQQRRDARRARKAAK